MCLNVVCLNVLYVYVPVAILLVDVRCAPLVCFSDLRIEVGRDEAGGHSAELHDLFVLLRLLC